MRPPGRHQGSGRRRRYVAEFPYSVDGPHSPERTAEIGTLFDEYSRYITYATMPEKHGLTFPSDACRLVADLYSATGRIPQVCDQLGQFLRAQEATGRLYEAQGRDIAVQVDRAQVHLDQAAEAARALTRALQAVQADIAGLGVKEDRNA
jgi:hypothetical protein